VKRRLFSRFPDRPILLMDRPITRSPDRPIFFAALLAAFALCAAGCGKKGDPQPPFPRGPRAITDLKMEQEAANSVLTFSYPDRLMDGSPLTDLASMEIYRYANPPAALTAPPRPPPPRAAGGPKLDEAPAAGARRAAVNARAAEQNFYREAEKIATLPVGEIARRTRGATIVYEDSLPALLAARKTPLRSLAYAVVSVRRGGEKSPLSNIVLLTPEVPPGAPVLLAVTPEEGRICLEWLPPDKDLLGQPDPKIGGYFVYRRALPDEDYGDPLSPKPFAGTSYVDTTAPYDSKLVYTIRATLPDKPRIEGPPSEEAALDYRDVFPPPAPARLDALPEASLVRLVWDPSGAPDLAGYAVYRSEGGGKPVRLNPELVPDSFFNDTTAKPGHRYTYTVTAVDHSGNASPASPAATAEPL
jgi:hypothetical protein